MIGVERLLLFRHIWKIVVFVHVFSEPILHDMLAIMR